MSCYFIAQINIHDPEEYEKYLDGYDEVFGKFKGEVVAVDDSVTLLEGEWPFGRTVVIKFPNQEELEQWYRSPGYQKLVKHRHKASTANIVAVKGRD